MPTIETVEADALQLSTADSAVEEARVTEPDEPPVPESHLRVVQERLADHRKGLSQTRSAFAFFDQRAGGRP